MGDHLKSIIDGASLAVTLGAILQWLPYIAAAFSIVWYVIRIYETRTVQRLLKGTNDHPS